MTTALGRTIRFTGSWRPVTLLAILGGVLLTSQGGRIAIAADARVAPPADPTRIAELITQLGSDDYFNREKAQAELTAVGAEAFGRGKSSEAYRYGSRRRGDRTGRLPIAHDQSAMGREGRSA